METSDVRRRVVEAIDRAKHAAAARRTRAEEAARDYAEFLDRIATPLLRQVASALRAHGHPFTAFTPGGSVRLASDKSEDFVELSLDTEGDQPAVILHSRRGRGSRVVEREVPVGQGAVATLTEAQLLKALLDELQPFVER